MSIELGEGKAPYTGTMALAVLKKIVMEPPPQLSYKGVRAYVLVRVLVCVCTCSGVCACCVHVLVCVCCSCVCFGIYCKRIAIKLR